MIDLRKLKELVRLMVTHELTELDLRDSEEQVTLRRHGASIIPVAGSVPLAALPTVASAAGESEALTTEDSDGMHRIESPMVGTFYSAAPNPDSPPFISVGSVVDPESTICIVEAMKIFNEIKAECSGTVKKVLVKNGEPIEFGQPLFLVETG